MENTSLIWIAAAGGVVASMWGYIQSIYQHLKNTVIVTVEIGGNTMSEAACHMVLHEFDCTPFSRRNFTGASSYIKSRNRNMVIAFERLGYSKTVFRKGWRPIVASYCMWSKTCEFSFIRGTFSVKELMEKITEQCDITLGSKRSRYCIRQLSGSIGGKGVDIPSMFLMMKKQDGDKESPNGEFAPSKYNSKPFGYDPDDVGVSTQADPVGMLALSADAMDAMMEAKYWKDNRQWYVERGIPWKRGWLLYGKPGTGKTSFVRAVAQTLDLPIVVLNIGTMTNKDLFEAWQTVHADSPCVVLIEDIDNVFEGRKNVIDGGDSAPLTFDCLLNVIDGVESNDGVFLIITTNHADKLDCALGLPDADGMACRPGRIDRAILFDHLDKAGMEKIAGRILVSVPHLIEEVVTAGMAHKDSGAQFQERCRKAAIRGEISARH